MFWVFAFIDLISDDLTGDNWNHLYVSRAPVVLQFEGEKLVRWEVLPDIRIRDSGYSGYAFQQSSDMMEQFQRDLDWAHHKKKGHWDHHYHPWERQP